MIKHIVMYRFPSSAPKERVDEIFSLLEVANNEISGMKFFSHGRLRGVLPKARGFSTCFVMDFDNQQSFTQYLEHRCHLAVRKKVRELVESEDDIFEFDYEYGVA